MPRHRRIKILRVHPGALVCLLKADRFRATNPLPDDATFTGHVSMDDGHLTCLVESNEFECVPEGEPYPFVFLQIARTDRPEDR